MREKSPGPTPQSRPCRFTALQRPSSRPRFLIDLLCDLRVFLLEQEMLLSGKGTPSPCSPQTLQVPPTSEAGRVRRVMQTHFVCNETHRNTLHFYEERCSLPFFLKHEAPRNKKTSKTVRSPFAGDSGTEEKKEKQHAQQSVVAVLRSRCGEGCRGGWALQQPAGVAPREGGSPDLRPGQVRMRPSAQTF